MFDTMKIAKVIRQARIDRDMTQMQLADAMGVSYQAVSNWERGNSMPDISKLEALCGVLEITVEQLLGIETAPVVEPDDMTVAQLREAAPAMPPAQIIERMKKEKKRRKLDVDSIIVMAPFLDEATLDELMDGVEVSCPEELAGLAPFISQETLKKVVKQYGVDDLDELMPLVPFLDAGMLDELMEDVEVDSPAELAGMAVFLGQETLAKLAERCEIDDLEDLVPLAPFLDAEALEYLVEKCFEEDSDCLEDMAAIAPLLSREALARILKNCL